MYKDRICITDVTCIQCLWYVYCHCSICPDVPGEPRKLRLDVASDDDRTVTLHWDPPAIPSDSEVQQSVDFYTIEQSINAGAFVQVPLIMINKVIQYNLWSLPLTTICSRGFMKSQTTKCIEENKHKTISNQKAIMLLYIIGLFLKSLFRELYVPIYTRLTM